MYSSTCFGCPQAHHQELNKCSISLWFYRWNVVTAVLLVVVCQTTTNNAPAAALQRLNQRLLVQLYAPYDERGDARNMLSHT